MERNEHYYNNYNDRYSDENNRERYSQRGNYYGISDKNYGSGNVRIQQRDDFNDFSRGPVGGHGGGNYNENYNRVHQNRDDHYRYGDDNHFRQSHGYSGHEDYRSPEYRNRNRESNQYDQNYSRSQPYSSNYEVTGNRRYARQENSYENPGHGRRFSDYGRDERRNYGHELTDIHHDRGEIPDSSTNDYRGSYRPANHFDFDENKEDYRYSGRIENTGSRTDQYRENMNRGRRPSGPDYSKWSPLGNYGYETFGI